jgi:hypothetical protein
MHMPKLPTYYYDHNAHQMLPMLREITIYVDTSAFQSNAAQHSTDPKSVANFTAMQTLNRWQLPGRYRLHVSNLNYQEISKTNNPTQMAKLREDYDAFGKVALNERLLFFSTAFDQRGGFVCSPIMSDIQDEPTRDELIKIGLTRDDAEHISQARANNCDYFLTRDEDTIIKYRDEIERRFPVKVRTPVEMVKELQSRGVFRTTTMER